MHLVRLLELPGHLRQQLVAGDSYVHREAQGVPDLVLQPVGRLYGASEQALRPGHIRKGLIDAVLLHRIRVSAQDFHESRGIPCV